MIINRAWASWGLVAVGYVAVIGAMFWRVFVRDHVVGWDSLDEYWPDLIFQSRAIWDGELPVWNPYTLGGYAFHADPQAGVLTPINWICILVSRVIGVGPALIQIKILLLFYAGAIGMHLLVWRWTRSHAAAAIAALIFVVGAPTCAHKNSALLWPVLHLPWAILAVDLFRARATPRRALLAGLALAMVGTSHPQGAFYCALVVAAYLSFRLGQLIVEVARHRASQPIRRRLAREARRVLPGALIAAVVALLWLAAVYLPAWASVGASTRDVRSLGWVLGGSLERAELAELFVPALDASAGRDLYLGPLAMILGVWSALVHRDGRLWLAVAALSILLALGINAFLLPWLADNIPGFGLFRIPYRYRLITGFACAAGAGLGVGVLASSAVARRHVWILLGLAAAWFVTALVITGERPTGWAILTVLALAGGALDTPPRRRWWLAAMTLLVAIDLWRASDRNLAMLEPTPRLDQGSELLALMPGIDRDWRFHQARQAGVRRAVPYHAALVHDVRELSGFEQPLATRRVLEVLVAARGQPELLAHFNVKYFVTIAPRTATRIGHSPIATISDVAPVARLYPGAAFVAADQILAELASVTPSALSHALVDPVDSPPPLPSSRFDPIDGRVRVFERARLVLEVDAPSAGILVINEAWSPRWQASIDGVRTPMFRANYLLRAMVVPPGRHQIELVFVAPGRLWLLVAAALGLALLLQASLGWRRLDREPGGGSPVA